MLLPALALAQPILGSGELKVLGVKLAVSPASQTVPRNEATGIATALVDGSAEVSGDSLPPTISDPTLAGMVVKGELSGPGITTGQTLTTSPGSLLPIPPLLTAGNYVVDNLRLEDGSGNFILAAEPAVASIKVIDRVIVTSVSSRQMSLDEIRERGIVIDESSFTAYEFTFGIGTQSQPAAPISLAVAFPKDDDLVGDSGFEIRASLPGLTLPNVEVKGIKLEGPEDLFDPTVIPPIPAVIVIPGNIAFLHQYFQVIVLVSNVAPAGSRLVVNSATATMVLPPGPEAVPATSDDPLGFPSINGVTSDGSEDLRNTANAARPFAAGEDASGELVVEALKEGTHRLEVTIDAVLQGLPIGDVPLRGKTVGTVLVRNPSFALSFNHPSVVRAGEPYSLFVTIHNTSDTDANLVTLSLGAGDVVGATLEADSDPGSPLGTIVVPTIQAHDAATVELELVAQSPISIAPPGMPSIAMEYEGGRLKKVSQGGRDITYQYDRAFVSKVTGPLASTNLPTDRIGRTWLN